MKLIYLLLLCFSLSIGLGSCNALEDYRWERSIDSQETSKITAPLTSNNKIINTANTVNTAGNNTYICTNEEKSLYDIEKERVTINILKESPIPLRTPDTILRVLMLPYTDNNNVLHSYYYTFLKVEDGNWVIGDYLNIASHKPKKMILHHIDAPLSSETSKLPAPENINSKKPSSNTATSHSLSNIESSFKEESD